MKNKDKIQSKLSKEDTILWKEVTKDITPINGSICETHITESPKKHKKSSHDTHAIPSQDYSLDVNHDKRKNNDIDTRTAQKLKRGQIQIEARLDLHGMSRIDAYDALKKFIVQSALQGKRCVLVITGKGKPRHGNTSLLDEKTGILKESTPQWLSEDFFNPYVLQTQTAKPKDGGEGALYVLLRKNRNAL